MLMHCMFKLEATFLLAAAGIAAAQDLTGQPQCAVSLAICLYVALMGTWY